MGNKRSTWMRSYRVEGYRLVEARCSWGVRYVVENKSKRVEAYALAVSGADVKLLFECSREFRCGRVWKLASMIADDYFLGKMRARECLVGDEVVFCFMTDPKPVKG